MTEQLLHLHYKITGTQQLWVTFCDFLWRTKDSLSIQCFKCSSINIWTMTIVFFKSIMWVFTCTLCRISNISNVVFCSERASDCLTDVVCMCCLNSSMVVLEMLMSLNIPSSFEVNWQPHSVCEGERQRTVSWNWDQYWVKAGQHEQSGRNHKEEYKEYANASVSKTFSLFYLELRDHVLLGVIWDTLVAEQPAAQMLLVVPFKHIFLLHKPEQHHGLVKDRLHLLFCQLVKQDREKKNEDT